jgi:hypothetical protein
MVMSGPGIYRAERSNPPRADTGQQRASKLIKYQAGFNAKDAEFRAIRDDDPIWRGVEFVFIESCHVHDMWSPFTTIIVIADLL